MGIVAFENNSLYEDHHFIVASQIDQIWLDKFNKTGNIGESSETKKAKIDEAQKLKAAQERIRENQ